jgi:hypothetical protein
VIPFRDVPVGAAGSIRRPLLDVYLDPAHLIPQTCLVDPGAAGIRLSADLARAAGVALPGQPNRPDVIVGATRSRVYSAETELALLLPDGPVTWTAEVACCDPWPHPFGLLGLRGFFDAFDVVIRGRDEAFSLTPR